MKIFFTFTLLFFLPLASFAQKPPKFIYCQISGSPYKLLDTQVTINMDYGQPTKLLADNRMRDPETGNLLVFNSIMDAMNYMAEQGWEFVQAYSESYMEERHETFFIMKRPFEESEEEDPNEVLLEE